jgi:hypothetical protein
LYVTSLAVLVHGKSTSDRFVCRFGTSQARRFWPPVVVEKRSSTVKEPAARLRVASRTAEREEGMRTLVVKGLLLLTFCVTSAAMHAPALASDWPLIPGDFVEVTAVKLKDGGAFSYANFLATEWRADQEFAKSKGWIKSYMVLSNAYPRKGEPDLYLVVISERIPSGPEADTRGDEYLAWKKKTQTQLEKESGNRLEIREVEASSLLQELKFRK